jgi:hypothetical protein
MTEHMQSAPSLFAAVADAYQAFDGEPAPVAPLAVCTFCCMRPELELQMREKPLRHLNREHFYGYNDSAKPQDQPAEEMRYLLPRMLELLAQGQDLHHSLELTLDRVGRCAAGSFNARQRAALSGFALAYFDAALTSRFSALGEDPLSMLLMIHIGGIDTQPLLDDWLVRNDPMSTVAYVDATYWNFWEVRDYTNPFAFDRPAFRHQLAEWILAPAHRARFIDKLLRPDFQQLAAAQPASGRMPFSTMVDAVFDQLTS